MEIWLISAYAVKIRVIGLQSNISGLLLLLLASSEWISEVLDTHVLTLAHLLHHLLHNLLLLCREFRHSLLSSEVFFRFVIMDYESLPIFTQFKHCLVFVEDNGCSVDSKMVFLTRNLVCCKIRLKYLQAIGHSFGLLQKMIQCASFCLPHLVLALGSRRLLNGSRITFGLGWSALRLLLILGLQFKKSTH